MVSTLPIFHKLTDFPFPLFFDIFILSEVKLSLPVCRYLVHHSRQDSLADNFAKQVDLINFR